MVSRGDITSVEISPHVELSSHVQISSHVEPHLSGDLTSCGDITSVEISPHVEISPVEILTARGDLTTVELSPHVETTSVEISPHLSGDLTSPQVEISPHAPQFPQIGKNMKGHGAGPFTPLKHHVPVPGRLSETRPCPSTFCQQFLHRIS
jgi:hypothetical protein